MLTVIAFTIGVTLWADTLLSSGVCVLVAFAGYIIGRIPWRITMVQIVLAAPVLAFLAILQGLLATTWERAGVMFLSIFASVVAATLVALTTRVSDVMEVLDRVLAPLSHIGVPTQTISLAFSLTLRLIPLQVLTVQQVLDARRARGGRITPASFGVPVIVRTVKRSEDVADALLARGLGD
ncbi:energy-coupling factor transporter transmembrane protein EcfT [Corynebacterium sp. TAE3-ERU12]|nr:energy-coupling factor transporter transmembrane protein EcfT [Corynebacterium sp. TAE3-ERU12]